MQDIFYLAEYFIFLQKNGNEYTVKICINAQHISSAYIQ